MKLRVKKWSEYINRRYNVVLVITFDDKQSF